MKTNYHVTDNNKTAQDNAATSMPTTKLIALLQKLAKQGKKKQKILQRMEQGTRKRMKIKNVSNYYNKNYYTEEQKPNKK